MCEELGKEIIVESAKAVAVETYKDTLHPALQAAGSIIALPLQAVDAALSKPKLWVAEKQFNYERTKKLLAEKLQNVPPENITPPENYVAIPALQQISYCFDSDELRDMYANLLAASMQKDKKWGVHPAFIDIIKQLTPDEAKLLKSLPPSLRAYHPVLEVHLRLPGNKGYNVLYSNYSNVADGVCDCPENICAYLENLDRLKLIELNMGIFITDKEEYERLKSTPIMRKITSEELEEGRSYEYQNGSFRLSSFGLSFVKMCILGN